MVRTLSVRSDSQRARVHPGEVLQSFDHYVMDLRDEGNGSTYFSLYAVKYSPRLGGGHVAFLRSTSKDGTHTDHTLTDTASMARRMRKRLKAMASTLNDYDRVPVNAGFVQRPFANGSVGWSIKSENLSITAYWRQQRQAVWVQAKAGTLAADRDVLTVFVDFKVARLVINRRLARGRIYWPTALKSRVGRSFTSAHVYLGETSLTPAGNWWRDDFVDLDDSKSR